MTQRLVEFAGQARALGAVCFEVEHQRLLPRTLLRFNLPDLVAADAFIAAARVAGLTVTNVGGLQVSLVVGDDQVGDLSRALGPGRQEIEGPR